VLGGCAEREGFISVHGEGEEDGRRLLAQVSLQSGPVRPARPVAAAFDRSGEGGNQTETGGARLAFLRCGVRAETAAYRREAGREVSRLPVAGWRERVEENGSASAVHGYSAGAGFDHRPRRYDTARRGRMWSSGWAVSASVPVSRAHPLPWAVSCDGVFPSGPPFTHLSNTRAVWVRPLRSHLASQISRSNGSIGDVPEIPSRPAQARDGTARLRQARHSTTIVAGHAVPAR
jgi:hypothetical protein